MEEEDRGQRTQPTEEDQRKKKMNRTSEFYATEQELKYLKLKFQVDFMQLESYKVFKAQVRSLNSRFKVSRY